MKIYVVYIHGMPAKYKFEFLLAWSSNWARTKVKKRTYRRRSHKRIYSVSAREWLTDTAKKKIRSPYHYSISLKTKKNVCFIQMKWK